MRPSGVASRRTSRLMSIPAAFSRWKISAPSGFSIGRKVTVKSFSMRSRSVLGSLEARKAKMSARAIVAVASLPCICDHMNTFTGPLPKVTVRSSLPCIDLPTSFTVSLGDLSAVGIARQNCVCVKRRSVRAATLCFSAMARRSDQGVCAAAARGIAPIASRTVSVAPARRRAKTAVVTRAPAHGSIDQVRTMGQAYCEGQARAAGRASLEAVFSLRASTQAP